MIVVEIEQMHGKAGLYRARATGEIGAECAFHLMAGTRTTPEIYAAMLHQVADLIESNGRIITSIEVGPSDAMSDGGVAGSAANKSRQPSTELETKEP